MDSVSQNTAKGLELLERLDGLEKAIKAAKDTFMTWSKALENPLSVRVGPSAIAGYGDRFNLSTRPLPDVQQLDQHVQDYQRTHSELEMTMSLGKIEDANVRSLVQQRLAGMRR